MRLEVIKLFYINVLFPYINCYENLPTQILLLFKSKNRYRTYESDHGKLILEFLPNNFITIIMRVGERVKPESIQTQTFCLLTVTMNSRSVRSSEMFILISSLLNDTLRLYFVPNRSIVHRTGVEQDPF